jgi:membrane-associated protein
MDAVGGSAEVSRAHLRGFPAVLLLALFHLPHRLAYLALFGLIAGESMGVPLPGETALLTAGVLASDGQLKLGLVILIAAGAAIIGDNLGFMIGRSGGRRLLERPGRFEHHKQRILEYGEPFFARHGAKTVFFGRWIAVLRVGAAWLAGVHGMRWRTFLLWNALGGIAWATSVALVAYAVGPTAEKIVSKIGIGAAATIVLIVVGLLTWRRLRTPRETT